jgi:hypothetical protein
LHLLPSESVLQTPSRAPSLLRLVARLQSRAALGCKKTRQRGGGDNELRNASKLMTLRGL